MSDYDLQLPGNKIISSFCVRFQTSFLKQGLQVLLHNGWFTYLSGTHHHLNELSVLFYAWFNCLKYSSFKHVVTFYAVHLHILRSANIIKLSTQKRKLRIKRKGDCFSLMSEGELIKVKTERFLSTPSGASLLVSSSPGVKLGSLTLMRHKMTFSHFSKDLIRPVSVGQSAVAVKL